MKHELMYHRLAWSLNYLSVSDSIHECWDRRHVPPSLVCAAVLCLLGKQSTEGVTFPSLYTSLSFIVQETLSQNPCMLPPEALWLAFCNYLKCHPLREASLTNCPQQLCAPLPQSTLSLEYNAFCSKLVSGYLLVE